MDGKGTPNVMLWGGSGSGGVRVLASAANTRAGDALAAALRREGLNARAESAVDNDKRAIAVVVNHV